MRARTARSCNRSASILGRSAPFPENAPFRERKLQSGQKKRTEEDEKTGCLLELRLRMSACVNGSHSETSLENKSLSKARYKFSLG